MTNSLKNQVKQYRKEMVQSAKDIGRLFHKDEAGLCPWWYQRAEMETYIADLQERMADYEKTLLMYLEEGDEDDKS